MGTAARTRRPPLGRALHVHIIPGVTGLVCCRHLVGGRHTGCRRNVRRRETRALTRGRYRGRYFFLDSDRTITRKRGPSLPNQWAGEGKTKEGQPDVVIGLK